jgi:hypothetical protein
MAEQSPSSAPQGQTLFLSHQLCKTPSDLFSVRFLRQAVAFLAWRLWRRVDLFLVKFIGNTLARIIRRSSSSISGGEALVPVPSMGVLRLPAGRSRRLGIRPIRRIGVHRSGFLSYSRIYLRAYWSCESSLLVIRALYLVNE